MKPASSSSRSSSDSRVRRRQQTRRRCWETSELVSLAGRARARGNDGIPFGGRTSRLELPLEPFSLGLVRLRLLLASRELPLQNPRALLFLIELVLQDLDLVSELLHLGSGGLLDLR